MGKTKIKDVEQVITINNDSLISDGKTNSIILN
jgi:hypothetical protein